MQLITQEKTSQSYWFVGAMHGSASDQLERFLKEGIWENGYTDKYLDLVRSIQVGDCIAIKSAYTQKYDLPFNTRGNTVATMSIKAVGIVKENPGNGRTIKVDWQRLEPYRQWYFFTGRTTIWKVSPTRWEAKNLLEFTFEGKEQDIDRFRNAPYWKERFGDITQEQNRFPWTNFYEELADKLLSFKDNRAELIAKLKSIADGESYLTYLTDQKTKGTSTGFLEDICPFTVIGIFNRNLTDINRTRLAQQLVSILNISSPIPENFNGIPVLNPQRAWFFGFSFIRKPNDIENLWNIFEKALTFADSNEGNADTAKNNFIAAFNNVSKQRMVGWNLTMALFWIRPWIFPPLDGNSRKYIEGKLNIVIGKSGHNKRCNGNEYYTLLDSLTTRFQEENFSVHSFPEMSLEAWRGNKATNDDADIFDSPVSTDEQTNEAEEGNAPNSYKSYTIESILKEGCFLSQAALLKILSSLKSKKNLILQGAPGTGKTWLAKKLAFALMGEKNENAICSMQFHPNLSYEDFIQGWRPTSEGKLALTNGPFIHLIDKALDNPKIPHVFIIEEINRGNPAQIFGEMLTLLEADKRTPDASLKLTYTQEDGKTVYIPDNLYVVGTMNIADRSLALVDLALRRRFAFITLEPNFGERWEKHLQSKHNIHSETLALIKSKMLKLNANIASKLGKQFCIGHSYVVPATEESIEDARQWFTETVETQIYPLLDEYFFDTEKEAETLKKELLEGF